MQTCVHHGIAQDEPRFYKDAGNFMETREGSVWFYATDWYIDADSVPMHLTPSSTNAILSSRASILESQETRQLLRASDKYHGTINVNLAKNDIVTRVRWRINNIGDSITRENGLSTSGDASMS